MSVLTRQINNPAVMACVVFTVALIIRLGISWILADTELRWDEPYYIQLAQRINQGDGFTFPYDAYHTTVANQPSSFQEPLYPLLLAGVLSVSMPGKLLPAYLAQALLGAISVVIFFGLALVTFDITTAILTGLAAAMYPPLLFFGHLLMTDTLFIMLLYAALLSTAVALGVNKNHLTWFVIGGLLFGLGSLTRTSMTGVTLLIAFLSFLMSLQRTRRPTQAMIGPLLLIVTALLVIMPWTIRNYLIHEEFILISTKAGYNLYFYNFPSEDVNFNQRVIPFPELDRFDEPERAKKLTDLGLGFIRSSPTTFLKYALVKFVDFWRPLPSSSNSSLIEQIFAVLTFTPIALAGLLGLCWSISSDALRVREFGAFATGILGIWLVQAMIFTGGFKARVAVEPLLLIYAAYAITRGFRHASWGRQNLRLR